MRVLPEEPYSDDEDDGPAGDSQKGQSQAPQAIQDEGRGHHGDQVCDEGCEGEKETGFEPPLKRRSRHHGGVGSWGQAGHGPQENGGENGGGQWTSCLQDRRVPSLRDGSRWRGSRGVESIHRLPLATCSIWERAALASFP